jgi:hypothetical protein
VRGAAFAALAAFAPFAPFGASLPLFALAACASDPPGPGPASPAGPTAFAGPPVAPGEPFAGRVICEAECRRSIRCGHGTPPQECYARCPTLPVRNPPAWRRDFVAMVVGCMDNSTCATDDDERCVIMNLAQAPADASERACFDRLPPQQRAPLSKAGRMCTLYSGLTPGADAWFAGCLTAPAAASCTPPLDWK